MIEVRPGGSQGDGDEKSGDRKAVTGTSFRNAIRLLSIFGRGGAFASVNEVPVTAFLAERTSGTGVSARQGALKRPDPRRPGCVET